MSLMFAAWYNANPQVVTTLLEAGADGKAMDSSGKTAFDYAKDNEDLKGTDPLSAGQRPDFRPQFRVSLSA